MPKRVLIAEGSSVIRGVAETLLRQNGYEVLSVGSYDKALEVLSFTRPDLLVIGGDLTNASGHRLYEQLQRDGKTASIPMLLFRDPEDMSLPFPDEVLVPRPFEAREFIEKVQVFSGMGNQQQRPQEQHNPLGAASLDDEFLDAALGLDKIDVTHSEVMNKTSGVKRSPQTAASGQMLGIAHHVDEQRAANESAKIESLMIKEDTTSISANRAITPGPGKGTSKIEILQDQYGMTDPKNLKPEVNETHDYNWFVNEMKQEVSAAIDPKAGKTPQASQSGGIKTTTAPVTTAVQPASQVLPGGKGRTVGVEKFIDEFKREIEKFRSDEPDPASMEAAKGQKDQQEQKIVWEETVERLNADTVGMFTRQLAHDLAEKIAEKIVSKIDADKLLHLIKNELLGQQKKR